MYRLTPEGTKKIEAYIKELEAKRKEILDAGLDTVNDTDIPTIEEIFEDGDRIMNKLDGFIAYAEKVNAISVVSIHCDFIVDNLGNRAVDSTNFNTFIKYVEGHYPKYIQKNVLRLKDDFERNYCFSLNTLKLGDKLYWNLDEFDMIRPKSIPCEVTGINADDLMVFTSDGWSFALGKDDIGGDITKTPLFDIDERYKENYYKVSFISGNSLKLISTIVQAENEQKAVEKVFDAHGPAFENRLVSVGLTSKPREGFYER